MHKGLKIMTTFDTRKSESEYEGCLVVLDVSVKNEGELTIEELEQIDDVMTEFGSERTGQRLEVNTNPDKVRSRVKYVYQETLLARSFDALLDRLEYRTPFDDVFVVIGTEVVELKD